MGSEDNRPVVSGWQTKPLETLCEGKGQYGANVPKSHFNPSLPRFVRITDLAASSKLVTTNPVSIGEADAQGYLLTPGDILLARSGSVGKSYMYSISDGRCAFAGYLIKFRPRPEILLPEYLKQFLHSDWYWSWVKDTQRTMAQPNINAKEYGSLPIPLPPLPEQRKIAAILSSVDDAIEKSSAVIDQLEVVKKALMQELLTRGLPGRHTRFKLTEIGEIPAEWEVKSLGEISLNSAFGPRFPSTMYNQKGDFATLRTTDISSDGAINYSTMPRAILPKGRFEEHTLIPGDLLITRSGTCGIASVFENHERPVIPGAFLVRFRLSRANNPFFIQMTIMSYRAQQELQKIAAGGVQKNLSGTNLKTVLLPIPSLDEQTKIIEYVSEIAKRIEIERNFLFQLNECKSALLSSLLSGEVRVPLDKDVA